MSVCDVLCVVCERELEKRRMHMHKKNLYVPSYTFIHVFILNRVKMSHKLFLILIRVFTRPIFGNVDGVVACHE